MKNSYLKVIVTAALLLAAGCSIFPGQSAFNVQISDRGAIQIIPIGAARSTQARMTDISSVVYELESTNGASNATSSIATASLTVAYVNGSPASSSVIFSNLWPGAATVSATIWGQNPIRGYQTESAEMPLGTASTTVTVESGRTTNVPMSIKMVETQTRAGSLQMNLGITEGDEVLAPFTPLEG